WPACCCLSSRKLYAGCDLRSRAASAESAPESAGHEFPPVVDVPAKRSDRSRRARHEASPARVPQSCRSQAHPERRARPRSVPSQAMPYVSLWKPRVTGEEQLGREIKELM